MGRSTHRSWVVLFLFVFLSCETDLASAVAGGLHVAKKAKTKGEWQSKKWEVAASRASNKNEVYRDAGSWSSILRELEQTGVGGSKVDEDGGGAAADGSDRDDQWWDNDKKIGKRDSSIRFDMIYQRTFREKLGVGDSSKVDVRDTAHPDMCIDQEGRMRNWAQLMCHALVEDPARPGESRLPIYGLDELCHPPKLSESGVMRLLYTFGVHTVSVASKAMLLSADGLSSFVKFYTGQWKNPFHVDMTDVDVDNLGSPVLQKIKIAANMLFIGLVTGLDFLVNQLAAPVTNKQSTKRENSREVKESLHHNKTIAGIAVGFFIFAAVIYIGIMVWKNLSGYTSMYRSSVVLNPQRTDVLSRSDFYGATFLGVMNILLFIHGIIFYGHIRRGNDSLKAVLLDHDASILLREAGMLEVILKIMHVMKKMLLSDEKVWAKRIGGFLHMVELNRIYRLERNTLFNPDLEELYSTPEHRWAKFDFLDVVFKRSLALTLNDEHLSYGIDDELVVEKRVINATETGEDVADTSVAKQRWMWSKVELEKVEAIKQLLVDSLTKLHNNKWSVSDDDAEATTIMRVLVVVRALMDSAVVAFMCIWRYATARIEWAFDSITSVTTSLRTLSQTLLTYASGVRNNLEQGHCAVVQDHAYDDSCLDVKVGETCEIWCANNRNNSAHVKCTPLGYRDADNLGALPVVPVCNEDGQQEG